MRKKQSRVLLLRFLKGPERSYDEDSAIEALQRGFPHLIDHVRTGRSEFLMLIKLQSLILLRLREVGILLKEQLLVPFILWLFLMN